MFLAFADNIHKHRTNMAPSLTGGALAKICQGEDITDPILQVLGHKPIQGSGQER